MAAIRHTFDTHICCFPEGRCVMTGVLHGATLCHTVQIVGGLLFLAFGVHALYEGIFSSS